MSKTQFASAIALALLAASQVEAVSTDSIKQYGSEGHATLLSQTGIGLDATQDRRRRRRDDRDDRDDSDDENDGNNDDGDGNGSDGDNNDDGNDNDDEQPLPPPPVVIFFLT